MLLFQYGVVDVFPVDLGIDNSAASSIALFITIFGEYTRQLIIINIVNEINKINRHVKPLQLSAISAPPHHR